MLRAGLYVITATMGANGILAPTLPDKPLFSNCIVRKHLEYLFESYALAIVFTRPVHGIYRLADIVCANLTGKFRKQGTI